MANSSASRLEQALRDEVREELRRVVELDRSDEHDEVRRGSAQASMPPIPRLRRSESPLLYPEGLANRLSTRPRGSARSTLLDDAGIEEIIVNGPHRRSSRARPESA